MEFEEWLLTQLKGFGSAPIRGVVRKNTYGVVIEFYDQNDSKIMFAVAGKFVEALTEPKH